MRAGVRRRSRTVASRLDGLPWMSGLPRGSRQLLDRVVERLELPPATVIAASGQAANWVTFVVEGDVAAVDDAGHVGHLRHGDAIGVAEALHHGVYARTYTTVSETSVVSIDRRQFVGALATVPGFSLALLRTFTEPAPEGVPRRSRPHRVRPVIA